MAFAENVWTLERRAAAPDFPQRFTGRFQADASTIAGRRESSSDGSTWSRDFDLVHTRLR